MPTFFVPVTAAGATVATGRVELLEYESPGEIKFKVWTPYAEVQGAGTVLFYWGTHPDPSSLSMSTITAEQFKDAGGRYSNGGNPLTWTGPGALRRVEVWAGNTENFQYAWNVGDPPPVPPGPPPANRPLGAVLEQLAGGVLDPGEYHGNALDLAQDLADRTGQRVSDDGYGVYRADPWPDATGTPVLTVSAGTNLIDSGIGLDIDTSGFAQQVRVIYSWETPNPDYVSGKNVVFEDGTVGEPYRSIGHRVEAVSAPSRGPRTLTVERKDIPVTQAQAQASANALGARAWARGRSLSVTCPVAWWVQPLDTVRVHLPYGPATDYLVSTVRHDSGSGTTTMTLRGATLIMNPPQA